MDTQALKDKILQLAIQGSWFSKWKWWTCISFIGKNKKEKEQLIKRKVIKRKPLPEITDYEKCLIYLMDGNGLG